MALPPPAAGEGGPLARGAERASPLGAAEEGASALEVPKGTVISVELVDDVNSAKNKAGDVFRARIEDGVWIKGQIALPPGSTVRGSVTEAVPSGRISGRAHLSLAMQSVEIDGKSYAVRSDTLSYTGEGHTGQHLGSWLGGAMQGALYGVLFGGKTGAIIGAGAGSAAGTAGSVFQGKNDVEFKQGAKLMFETMQSLTVPAAQVGKKAPGAAGKEAQPLPAAPSKAAAPAAQEPPKPAAPSKDAKPSS